MRKRGEFFDFGELGKAIKEARLAKGLTREQAAALIPIDPRYLTNIENKGKNPSLQIFYKIITVFELSVDQFFYPDSSPVKTTRRRQLDNLLDSLNESDYIIMEATASGILKSKEQQQV